MRIWVLFIGIAMLMLLSSCSWERRLYRNGFYVDWSSGDHSGALQWRETVNDSTVESSNTELSMSRTVDSSSTEITEVNNKAIDSTFLKQASDPSQDSIKRQETKKREAPKREDVYKCKQLSLWAFGLGLGGLGMTVAAAYVFSFGLFIIGFFAVGVSLILAMYVLYRIHRISDLYPELRWPSTSRKNFESPYMNAKTQEEQLLWSLRKARMWAIIISWVLLIGCGTGVMLAFSI